MFYIAIECKCEHVGRHATMAELYYYIKYSTCSFLCRYLKNPDIEWDYASMNIADQTVLDFYEALPTKHPVVVQLLKKALASKYKLTL